MSKMKHVVLLGAGAIGVLPAAKLAGCGGVKLTVAADAGHSPISTLYDDFSRFLEVYLVL